MSCYLCKSDKYSKRTGSVRDKPDIDVLECSDCGLVYLSSLEHTQDQHYEGSGMHDGEVPNIDKLNSEYESQLASIGKTDTIIIEASK